MDLKITELLVTSLLVQATRAMVAEGSEITRTEMSRTRSQVVEEAFEKILSQRSPTVTNGAGWDAGRAPGDRARITVERQAVDA
ncbi:hypothetical protein FXN61_10820 [Lentzea sp. PSKA42]|uniref:Uncharacterized protein n=1 Tax=Lentzea indica TaxID=2604800 RepID=A0ABX1FEN2_9PSEU|nr:hypothetical protein [Lentzea indica]NKE57297.1 hypothetical protein [Lentzea indica]